MDPSVGNGGIHEPDGFGTAGLLALGLRTCCGLFEFLVFTGQPVVIFDQLLHGADHLGVLCGVLQLEDLLQGVVHIRIVF